MINTEGLKMHLQIIKNQLILVIYLIMLKSNTEISLGDMFWMLEVERTRLNGFVVSLQIGGRRLLEITL